MEIAEDAEEMSGAKRFRDENPESSRQQPESFYIVSHLLQRCEFIGIIVHLGIAFENSCDCFLII